MQDVREFDRFLIDEVNLNSTRIELLTSRVESVSTFLKDSDWGPWTWGFSPQGSWAHKTIIKPPGNKGFDADLLMMLQPIPGWSARDYVAKLRDLFAGSGVYKDLVGISTRCVTLEYVGDFTLDVVPCIVQRTTAYRYEVCNRRENAFEPTDGEGYSTWFAQQNGFVGRNRLREVVRLLKYLRDIKLTFSCKSILLTTLVGERVSALDVGLPQAFADLPTSLKTLINRLDDYLQARPALHEVRNPVLPEESFVRHWDEDKYATFRDMIHKYRGWIDEAYAEPDPALSLDKWQRVFGDEFGGGKRAIVEQLTEDQVSGPALGLGAIDTVETVRRYGTAALNVIREKLPWVKVPPWRMAPNMSVVIAATGHNVQGGPAVATLHSGQVLQPDLHLRFEALGRHGQHYSANADAFEVQWQVVNTGAVARRVHALRGGFERSGPAAVRWERTSYHGIHWVQAFLIRKRDRACVGTSERYFVVVA